MTAEAPARRCGVLGSPISHSLSPILHRAAYVYLGLSWSYTAHEVRGAELAGFIHALDESWRGLSLTMPLKRVALDVANRASDLAETVGAANTLTREGDGSWAADNTDVTGLIAAIRERGADRYEAACVWGGGATAASTVAALVGLGTVEIHLHARDAGRTGGPVAVADRLGSSVAVLPWRVRAECAAADLVVSTVPAGAADAIADELAGNAGPHRLLIDVVYAPWPTQLAVAWEKRGGVVSSGLDLLVHQAVGQLKLMTGHDVPARVLFAAVR